MSVRSLITIGCISAKPWGFKNLIITRKTRKSKKNNAGIAIGDPLRIQKFLKSNDLAELF